MKNIKNNIYPDFFLTEEENRNTSEIKHVESHTKKKYGVDEQLYRFKNFFIYPATIRNTFSSSGDELELKTDNFERQGNFLEDLFLYRNALFADLEALHKKSGFRSEDSKLVTLPEAAKKSIEEIANNKSLTEIIANMTKNELSFLINAFYFTPFWVNRLDEFDFNAHTKNNARMENLLYHLFGKNKIPLFLLNAWIKQKYTNGCIDNINSMCLSIIIARGEQIENAIKKFKWNLDEGMYQQLFEVDIKNRIEEGFLQAYVYQKGGNSEDYDLIKDLLYLNRYDPLDYGKHIQAVEIKSLYNFIPWIINSKRKTRDEIEMIIKWAVVQFIEDKSFSIDKFSFTEALKCAKEYEEARSKNAYIPRSIIAWERKFDIWEYNDEKQNKWTIIELVNNMELFSEPEMNIHDIYSYVWKCKQGSIRILCLKLNDASKLVFSVDIASGFIINPLRTFLIPLDEEELSILTIWEEQILKKFRINYRF